MNFKGFMSEKQKSPSSPSQVILFKESVFCFILCLKHLDCLPYSFPKGLETIIFEHLGESYYQDGKVYKQTLSCADAWFSFQNSCLFGHAKALFEVGYCLFWGGLEVDRDLERAKKILKESGEKGDALAYFYLGRCIQKTGGAEKDSQEYVEKALSSNRNDVLGEAYVLGLGVKTDYKKGFEHLCKAYVEWQKDPKEHDCTFLNQLSRYIYVVLVWFFF